MKKVIRLTENDLERIVSKVIEEQQPKKTCQFSDVNQFIAELKNKKQKGGRWYRYKSKPEMVGLTAAAQKLDFQELENRFCNIQATKLQLPKGKNEGRWSFDGTNITFI